MTKHEEHKLCLDFMEACDKLAQLSRHYQGAELNKQLNEEIAKIKETYLPDSWDEEQFYLPNGKEPKVEYLGFWGNWTYLETNWRNISVLCF